MSNGCVAFEGSLSLTPQDPSTDNYDKGEHEKQEYKLHTKIWSRHFQDSDFRITHCGRKFLKPESIPSVFANRGSTSRWKESHQKLHCIIL